MASTAGARRRGAGETHWSGYCGPFPRSRSRVRAREGAGMPRGGERARGRGEGWGRAAEGLRAVCLVHVEHPQRGPEL